MLKKTITYLDFNDVERKEDFYFNLTKGELVEMELTADGNSFREQLQAVIDSNNGKKIIDTFKEIIFKAYGEKSEDGKRFLKSEEISKNFEATNAFSELFVELITDAESASSFVNGLVPKDLAADAQKSARELSEAQMQGYKKPEEATVKVVPELPTEAPVLAQTNQVDILNMSTQEFEAYKAQQASLLPHQEPRIELTPEQVAAQIRETNIGQTLL